MKPLNSGLKLNLNKKQENHFALLSIMSKLYVFAYDIKNLIRSIYSVIFTIINL